MSGIGSLVDPCTLAEALSSQYVSPGHTLHLRGGTYTGDFVSNLYGDSDNPITVKPYVDPETGIAEKPIIDGSLTINGRYQLWQDIEVLYSGWASRTTLQTGSSPTDIPRDKAFVLAGIGNKCNGLILHDLSQCTALTGGSLSELSGCLIYNIGWLAPDRGHGHSLYLQNITGRKIVKRCISVNSFGFAWHAYTEGGNIDYLDFIETTCINAGGPVQNVHAETYQMLTGGLSQAVEPRWYRNMTYNCLANLGYSAGYGFLNAVAVDNFFQNSLPVASASNVYAENSGNVSSKPASGTYQFCYQDEYKNTRGFLTVYNLDLQDTITADLSAITGLSVGDTVRLRCAEDYHGCYQDLVLDANKCVTVDMLAESHSVATAIAHNYTPPTNCPEFGCFIVEKQ